MTKLVSPEYGARAFSCPFCGVFAVQIWLFGHHLNGSLHDLIKDIAISTCESCHQSAVWIEDLTTLQLQSEIYAGSTLTQLIGETPRVHMKATKATMIYPAYSPAPMPAEDMPDDVKHDFMEAREIVSKSPKGAAALLRLAIQKLMVHLGEKGENINHDIGSLVKKGLHPNIQKSLDVVRVIGNDAVHPGRIDWRDDKAEIALTLFKLVNVIIDQMITRDKEVDAIYSELPKQNLDAIAKRDQI